MELDLTKPQTREFTLDRSTVNKDNRTFTLSFSSELPVERWWGIEILSHDPKSIRLERMKTTGPLLMNHDGEDLIGKIESALIDEGEKKGRATVRFGKSPRAEEIMNDVLDGIRSNVSVGYQIHKYEEMEAKDLSPELLTLAANKKLPVYRVTDWEPLEISIVSIPADPTVGVGRNLNNDSQTIKKGEETMPPEVKEKTADEIQKAERERQKAIREIAAKFVGRVEKIDELRDQALNSDVSADLFKGQVADRIADSKPIDTNLEMSEKEVKSYSIVRAINAAITGDWSKAGFERELSNEIIKRRDKGIEGKGFVLPFEILRQKRDLSVGTTTAGGYLKGTQLDAANYIDLLRNKMLFNQLGANVMTGLKGDIAFPKLVTAATFYYISTEGDAPTESNQVFGQVSLAPKYGGTFVDYTFKLLQQSTPSIDSIVQNDLLLITQLAMDKAGFHGSGSSGQPYGIVATTGVGTFTGTDLGWEEVVSALTDIQTANADVATCAYVTDPATYAKLLTREQFAGAGQKLISDQGTINGYKVWVTNQITANYMIFGDFAQAIVGIWGDGIDILVDPYTASSAGSVRVRVLVGFDIAVRIAAAFTYASSIT